MTSSKPNFTRSIPFAVIISILAGGLTVMVVEAAGHLAFGGGDPNEPSTISFANYASVLFAWIVGSAVAGATAAALARRRFVGIGVTAGLFFVAAAVMNFVAFPHPIWMMVLTPLLLPSAGVLSAKSVASRQILPNT